MRIAVTLGMLLAACTCGIPQTPAALEAKIVEAKALGLALTPAELHWDPIPDSDNGLLLIDKALKLGQANPLGPRYMTLVARALPATATEDDRQVAILCLPNLQFQVGPNPHGAPKGQM